MDLRNGVSTCDSAYSNYSANQSTKNESATADLGIVQMNSDVKKNGFHVKLNPELVFQIYKVIGLQVFPSLQ